ncbi:hypothetical protein SDC9_208663 [bioreactor metagenome]|uniref:Uncharacterized protein n=1 Tax=bioreactor metagenome TaxID=1076179 RepID=A0A645JCY1_9ZZZZ
MAGKIEERGDTFPSLVDQVNQIERVIARPLLFPAVAIDKAFPFAGFQGERNKSFFVVGRFNGIPNYSFTKLCRECMIRPPFFHATPTHPRGRVGVCSVDKDMFARDVGVQSNLVAQFICQADR